MGKRISGITFLFKKQLIFNLNMPRGRGSGRRGGHKGGRRVYTTAESIQEQEEKIKKEQEWRKQRGDLDSDEEEEKEKEKKSGSEESESESESSEDEKVEKPKGVQHLIPVENPNRIKRTTKKVSEVDTNSTAQMSRKEREEMERIEAKKRYEKLHAAGKTEEAQSD